MRNSTRSLGVGDCLGLSFCAALRHQAVVFLKTGSQSLQGPKYAAFRDQKLGIHTGCSMLGMAIPKMRLHLEKEEVRVHVTTIITCSTLKQGIFSCHQQRLTLVSDIRTVIHHSVLLLEAVKKLNSHKGRRLDLLEQVGFPGGFHGTTRSTHWMSTKCTKLLKR